MEQNLVQLGTYFIRQKGLTDVFSHHFLVPHVIPVAMDAQGNNGHAVMRMEDGDPVVLIAAVRGSLCIKWAIGPCANRSAVGCQPTSTDGDHVQSAFENIVRIVSSIPC